MSKITANLGQWTQDADESAFFERELLHVYAQTYDIKYPELKARSFVPVSNQANPGALEVTYRQFDRRGQARLTAPGAIDVPRVDVLGTEFPRPVRMATAAYGWHLMEIRQAAMAGRPLDTRKAAATRRAVEEVVDEDAFAGTPDFVIASGFINEPNITIDVATGVWSTLTADQIIADVSAMVQGIIGDTNGVEIPDTLILPPAQWALISTLPRSTQSDTTVMQFLMASFPMITAVEWWHRLTGAGAGGVDRAVVYKRSPDILTQEIPSEFEQLPVFQKGQNFEIETLMTTAGTAWYYPLAGRYLDGL